MSAKIPASHKDLLADQTLATVTTVFEDGQPQSTVVWKKYDGNTIKFSTLGDRQKAINLESNPKVSVMFVDPQNPYRYLEIRGTASMSRDGAHDLADELARTYTDKESYYGGLVPAENKSKEDRVIVTIEPEHVVTYGD